MISAQKNSKSTLQVETGKHIFNLFLVGTLLFATLMVVITIQSLKLVEGSISKYTGTYLAREMNSRGFLSEMGINDLSQLDPNSKQFKNWTQTLHMETIDIKTNDAVIKLQKPLQLVTIVVKGRIIYTNMDQTFALTPIFEGLYSNRGNCKAKGESHGIMRTWGSPREYPLYATDGKAIGHIKICVDPEIFLIFLMIILALFFIFILIVLMAVRYASNFMAVPLVAPLNQLQNRILALAEMDPAQSFDSRLEIEHPLKEIEGLAEATNHLIEKLQFLSMHDALTNTKNRAYYESEILRLESESTEFLGVIICDVDHLKLVNDSKGHKYGDILLINAANILRESIRPGDMLARIGGDEFAIFIYDADLIDVERTRDRIRSNIKKFNEADPEIHLGISIGIALGHTAQNKVEDLVREADRKMYIEKRLPISHGTVPTS